MPCPSTRRRGRGRQAVPSRGTVEPRSSARSSLSRVPAMLGKATVDALDDVVALTECPQRRPRVCHESPLAWTNLMRESEPFKLPHASDLDRLQVIGFPIAV